MKGVKKRITGSTQIRELVNQLKVSADFRYRDTSSDWYNEISEAAENHIPTYVILKAA